MGVILSPEQFKTFSAFSPASEVVGQLVVNAAQLHLLIEALAAKTTNEKLREKERKQKTECVPFRCSGG